MDLQKNFRNQTFAVFTAKSGSRLFQNHTFREEVFSSDMFPLDDVFRFLFVQNMIVPEEGSLYKLFEDFTLRCHQSGIISYIESMHFLPEVIQPTDTRKVLTLHLLSAGFYIWLISVVVACIVFVVEHVVRYFSRTRYLKNRNMDEYFNIKLYD